MNAMATQTDMDLTAESIWHQLYSECLDKIKAYQNDLLEHDKDWVLAHPKVPFFHATRKWGTHMIPLAPLSEYPPYGQRVPYLFGTADRIEILRGTKYVLLAALKFEQRLHWLHFDGSRLWPSNPQEAQRVIERYIALVERVWGNPVLQRLACANPAPADVRISQHHGTIRGSMDGQPFDLRGDEDMAILLSVLLEADGHFAMYS